MLQGREGRHAGVADPTRGQQNQEVHMLTAVGRLTVAVVALIAMTAHAGPVVAMTSCVA